MADPTTSSSGGEDAKLTYWREGVACCDEEWERAYTDFETPEEEIRKFLARHRKLGYGSIAVPTYPAVLDYALRHHGTLPLATVAEGVIALADPDQVAIVVYAGASGLVLPSTPGDRKEEILEDFVR